MSTLFQYDADGELLFNGKKLSDYTNLDSRSVYAYSKATILDRVQQYQSALSGFNYEIHYAVKANACPGVLQLLADAKLGADVVSGGELKIALEFFAANKVIFSGTGKTKAEIKYAIEAGIKQINVESVEELKRISEMLNQPELSEVSSVDVGLRLNPSVDAKTHPYISTGFRDNKFGIDETQIQDCYDIIKANSKIKLRALTCHIGSQLLEFSAMRSALKKMRRLCQQAVELGFPMDRIDIGGGVGIQYEQDAAADKDVFDSYMQVVQQELSGIDMQIMTEPGRFIVARAGVLLTEVQYVKRTPHKTFVICSSGMNHLMRPALYQAYHRIFPLKKRIGSMKVDVVGPICESSDFLAKDREISKIEPGDWLAVADSGAYGYSMATPYNAFDFPLETLIE